MSFCWVDERRNFNVVLKVKLPQLFCDPQIFVFAQELDQLSTLNVVNVHFLCQQGCFNPLSEGLLVPLVLIITGLRFWAFVTIFISGPRLVVHTLICVVLCLSDRRDCADDECVGGWIGPLGFLPLKVIQHVCLIHLRCHHIPMF